MQTNVTRFIKYREPQPPAAHEIYNSLVRSGFMAFDRGTLNAGGTNGYGWGCYTEIWPNAHHGGYFAFSNQETIPSGGLGTYRVFGFPLRCLAS